ncbi:hypothetical protein [Taibaiella soli]|uniref:Uncharacterized protein n=1 Tax=Taibaiella soli TaxID=1649169 RepID=A0A2W2AKU5_9BACT|nr:hypothetical protein [Taibaiella soli]PZF74192.1 hypothetical protein DN068_04020 [Taibaiella soli]
MVRTFLLLTLIGGLVACRREPMHIYPLAPYVTSVYVEGVERMREYYVVENYHGDTAALRQYLDKFVATVIKDKPQKHDQFYLYIYQSSGNANKNTSNTGHIEPEFDYVHDLIADRTWGHIPSNRELHDAGWSFYEDGKFLLPQN